MYYTLKEAYTSQFHTLYLICLKYTHLWEHTFTLSNCPLLQKLPPLRKVSSATAKILKPIPNSSCYRNTGRISMGLLGHAIVALLFFASLAIPCQEQEKSSLLQFVSELSQDDGLSNSWGNATDCCKWEGISCSSENTVTDVFLARRNLEGHISPSLGNLTSLLRLNLSHNLLSGGLPLELLFSKSIIVLDISFNLLHGDLQGLPSSTLQPMQVLNISSNLFTGRFPSTSWEAMKGLVVLNASNNSFTGQIPTTFCVSMPAISVLELSYNQFSGGIPSGLGNCSMLTSLNAGSNNLSGNLPDELFSLTLLEHLSFPQNQLERSLRGISKLTNLVTLDLGGNRISGNIPDSIGELKRLEELHLDCNSMSSELPSTLGRCTNLRTINLRRNMFSGELTRVNFSAMPNLETLDVVWNNLTGTIPESIYSCSNLTALRLSGNRFHGQLSERIVNLRSLSFLSLVGNSLTNITSALQILRSCSNLVTLLIGRNFMHEAMPEDDRIDGFKNLQVFSISRCSLHGKMPPWLSKLTNLEMLFLYSNQLTGPIPEWMSNLNFLFYIDITNNSFTGEIPAALMEMPMLKTDKVAPKAFEIPVYITQSLQYSKLGSFPKVLNLGTNNLTGVIPKEIGQLKELLSLNLSFNNLSGEIPQSICNLTNLEVLDLSSNRLTGVIPTTLNSLHFLSEFNISNNDLEGPIPIMGQLSTFPNSSFDGNPKLCGPMLAQHCGSSEKKLSTEVEKPMDERVIFVIAFGAFFCVGVLYDQIVLSRFLG
jgi:Leucine-rich repeat (LRR) protein